MAIEPFTPTTDFLDEEEAQELRELMNAPPGSLGTLSRPLTVLEPASESLMERLKRGQKII